MAANAVDAFCRRDGTCEKYKTTTKYNCGTVLRALHLQAFPKMSLGFFRRRLELLSLMDAVSSSTPPWLTLRYEMPNCSAYDDAEMQPETACSVQHWFHAGTADTAESVTCGCRLPLLSTRREQKVPTAVSTTDDCCLYFTSPASGSYIRHAGTLRLFPWKIPTLPDLVLG